MSSRNFITSAMILWILALIIRCFLRWIFFITTSSCCTISKVRHIRILKKSTNTFLRNRNPRIYQNLNYKPAFKFWYLFPLYINKQLKKFQKIWPKRKKVIVHSWWNYALKLQKIERYSYHSNAYFVSIFLYMHIKYLHIFPESIRIALFQV